MTQILLRRDTLNNWATSNPVLGQGEIGIVLNTDGKFKIGDGATEWNSLSYATGNIPTASTTVLGGVRVDGVTTVVNNGVLSAVTGGSLTTGSHGIKGDYATHFGILECPNGLISYTAVNKTVTIHQGLVLNLAGNGDTKTLISSDEIYDVIQSQDFTLFYASPGTFIEAVDVFYQVDEPEDGESGYAAWWNPEATAESGDKGAWKFKSNDTGNVWREAPATPIADFHMSGDMITTIDYIGYRLLDDDIIVSKSHLEDIVDGQTIEVVNGKLSCNLDELGGEVNSIAGRVSTLETTTTTLETDISSIDTALGDLKFVRCTQTEYDALETKDANTLYIITGE